jgi:predicted MPP superfamily phosphohydrolase
VTIYLVTDTHFISPSLTDNGEYYSRMIRNGDGKFMPYCSEINDAMIEKVIKDRPAAFIVAGDLTFNGAQKSHEEFARKLRKVEDAGIPVLAIPGNHDLTLKRAAKFEGDSYELVRSIDASEYLDLYVDFGRQDSYDLSFFGTMPSGRAKKTYQAQMMMTWQLFLPTSMWHILQAEATLYHGMTRS